MAPSRSICRTFQDGAAVRRIAAASRLKRNPRLQNSTGRLPCRRAFCAHDTADNAGWHAAFLRRASGIPRSKPLCRSGQAPKAPAAARTSSAYYNTDIRKKIDHNEIFLYASCKFYFFTRSAPKLHRNKKAFRQSPPEDQGNVPEDSFAFFRKSAAASTAKAEKPMQRHCFRAASPFPELRAPCNQAGAATPTGRAASRALSRQKPPFASYRRTMRQCPAKTASLPARKDRFPGIEPDKRPIGAKCVPAPAKEQNADFQRKKPRNLA